MITIKRALLSVSDKEGIVELAQQLQSLGCEIISTGGTKKKLLENGIEVTDISKVTGNPEAFGGRMKTISFNIESALLFDREKDAEEAASLNIEPIDLVVCNLYPFQKVLEQGADFETLIENIDIGGPTMVRASAKNFKYVAVATSPSDYPEMMRRLAENNGALDYEYRKYLMAKAFSHTADYDALIADTMNDAIGEKTMRLTFEGGNELRYGENSHQAAAFYQLKNNEGSLYDVNILHGKALSYNNILDISGAVNSVKESDTCACAVIKHSNPCGFAEGRNQREVLENAWAGDPISAFGSIIAFNRPLTKETVEFFELNNEDRSKRKFIEVVIAPKVEADALEYLQHHKNLRVLEFDAKVLQPTKDFRFMDGSLLVQDPNNKLYDKLEVVTSNKIDLDTEKELVEFGLRAIKNIKSNSIAIVRQHQGNLQLMGMGAGQPNRLVATHLAVEKSRECLTNEFTGTAAELEAYIEAEMAKAVLISDAFFPFADNVELAASKGIRKIVQPGGSIRDKSVIDTCDDLGVAMLLTGTRHFKH